MVAIQIHNKMPSNIHMFDLRSVLSCYPQKSFILIGNSGSPALTST